MRETKEQNLKYGKQITNKGITLIALVITIIVMLILVAVTITMAVNGGLFEYARKAGTQTNDAIKEEQKLANGGVTIGETFYNTIDDYVNEIKITFTVNNVTYDAIEGQTWSDWIKKIGYKYGFEVSNDFVFLNGVDVVCGEYIDGEFSTSWVNQEMQIILGEQYMAY